MASYQGYSGAQGYDPERAKVDRSRRLAEMLQEGALDTGPKSFWEGAAQLGKAFIARGAMDRADKAESAYGDAQKQKYAQMADTISGMMYRDTPAISSGAKTTFAPTGEAQTTPGGIVTPQQQDPRAKALRFFVDQGMHPLEANQAVQSMAPKPREYSAVEFGTGGVGAFDPTTGTMNTLVQPTAKPADPTKWEDFTDASGQLWQTNPYTGEKRKVDGLRARVPESPDARATYDFKEIDGRTWAINKNNPRDKIDMGPAGSGGDAVFDGPQLATIYNKNMSYLDDVTAAQKDLDFIAGQAQEFIDAADKGGYWAQGEGIFNDAAQALSMDTTKLKAITDSIAPLMRRPGSGASSDTDVKMFKSAAVNINNTPEANKRFAQGAQAMAQRNREYSAFLNDTIDPRDPQSRQKAQKLWNMYSKEQPIFNQESGEVLEPLPFSEWMAIQMGEKAPPQNFLSRQAGKIAGMAQPAPAQDGSDLVSKWLNQ